ncbi:MAG: hypothetical protein ACREWG_00500 [Gammaproteobacteria bacterium]
MRLERAMCCDLRSADRGLIGVASVIDGDTLEIHGRRIRLYGVNEPE